MRLHVVWVSCQMSSQIGFCAVVLLGVDEMQNVLERRVSTRRFAPV